jgi:hypothetical protein
MAEVPKAPDANESVAAPSDAFYDRLEGHRAFARLVDMCG